MDLNGYDVGSIASSIKDVPACQIYCNSSNAGYFTLKPNGCYCKTSGADAKNAPGPGYISGKACGSAGRLMQMPMISLVLSRLECSYPSYMIALC